MFNNGNIELMSMLRAGLRTGLLRIPVPVNKKRILCMKLR